MKRNIAYVVESIFEPGPVFQLRQLLRQLDSNEFNKHVISLSSADNGSEFFGNHAELHVLSKARFAAGQGLKLRKLLSTIQPNIVHRWGLNSTIQNLLGTWKTGSKTITSVFENSNPSDVAHFSRWMGTDAIVAGHGSLKDSLAESGLKRDLVAPLTPFDDHYEKARSRYDLLSLLQLESQDVYLAGTVSRLEPRFRMKDLVWAIDLLCRVRTDIHLVILAQGCDRALRNYISKLKCGENVHFLPREQCQMKFVAGLDMYWNCQTIQPASPAIITAMQHEIPVVSVLSEETSDLILPLQSALATNYGSRDEFARWTKYVIEQPESAKQLAAQGKQHVENMLTKHSMVDAYRNLYIDLTSKGERAN